MYELNIDGILFRPKLEATKTSGTIGCFSGVLTWVRLQPCWPVEVDGKPYHPLPPSGVYGRYKHHGKFKQLLDRFQIADDYVPSHPGQGIAGQGLTHKILRKLGVDPAEEMLKLVEDIKSETAMKHALTSTGVNTAVSMYVLGDNIGVEHSSTSHFVGALKKLQIGTIVESPAVANPNHYADQSLCMAWFWIPPWAESVSIARTPSPGTRLARDMTELEHNLKKKWDYGLMHQPNKELFEAPEVWIPPLPEAPVVRKPVRVRKPRTIRGELSSI